ncbi:TRAP transporter small permease [Reinekea sp.]|jgi:TRAP-type C4-dicarboxylate transport system permease small subunit|uniref:TRAP transporter small permease n=1 Tax=Reinekea sp. TaxID=1970455 RepID=UPI00398945EB
MRKWAEHWARIERGLLVLVLLCMIILAVLQIILRNVFDTSMFWIDPLNRLFVLWLAILGAMVATKEGEHIAIDALKHYLAGVKLWLVTKLVLAFSAVICGLMAFHSTRFVYEEYLYETTTFSELPAWPFQLIMPVGFTIMALRFTASLLMKPKEGAL